MFGLGVGIGENRYPQDPHDRLWFNWTDTSWKPIYTNSSIVRGGFDVPSLVLQTAAVPSSANGSIDIKWSASDNSTSFFVLLHIAEIQIVPNNSLREFYLCQNEENILDPVPLTYHALVDVSYTYNGHIDYNISLKPTARATLPPILNAFELYTIMPTTWLPTQYGDGTSLVLYFRDLSHNNLSGNIPATKINQPTDHDIPPNFGMAISSNVIDNPKDPSLSEAGRKELNVDKRKFSYEELKVVTNNFSHQIGFGGFGKVFKGHLEDGNEVAVKVRSELSSQGIQQFLNEVENLSRVHHKNLVSLIGYCKDRDHIALVYEYMQNGSSTQSLQWKQRLWIAYESAQGLEYLHKMCSPPLIHRDVKTTNILLTTNLEAKVSDFGLVRDCSGTHVSTLVIGTPGYLDPYYVSTSKLTEKSDVYSFGVVLLEVITGNSVIQQGQNKDLHLTQFVLQRLSKGNIESILDQNMGPQYNINSIWKVADLALRCTDQPAKRPDMTAVVTELKETLNLELSTMETSSEASENISQYSNYSRFDYPFGGEAVAELHGTNGVQCPP
ncbi:hypothetical protein LUZ61_021140 [Rhynchospora tenuis]|uniref:Protein kinase domain-containing protein n=1 Tax=Rhynchospora tenuis TaxID=198213 RepID=A0AAD5Z2E9_9POAL|nr:hypothetical protein LUZ61_021140 [Rhynchospora tenuis]